MKPDDSLPKVKNTTKSMCIFKILGVIICTSVWTKAVIHVEINEID